MITIEGKLLSNYILEIITEQELLAVKVGFTKDKETQKAILDLMNDNRHRIEDLIKEVNGENKKETTQD